MEGRGEHWFKKVNGVLGSGFVNTEKEEVVCLSRCNKDLMNLLPAGIWGQSDLLSVLKQTV